MIPQRLIPLLGIALIGLVLLVGRLRQPEIVEEVLAPDPAPSDAAAEHSINYPPIQVPPSDDPKVVFKAACAACHGPEGQGNFDLRSPSIAALPSWFVRIQFDKFRKGWRGDHEEDVTGAAMREVALQIPEDMLDPLAEYVQTLPRVATVATLPSPPGGTEQLYFEHCAECHRYNAQGERVFRSAPLSSLQDWYIADSVRKFRDEVRGYHRQDIDGIFMHKRCIELTNEDIDALAAWVAVLAERYPPTDRTRSRKEGRKSPIVGFSEP